MRTTTLISFAALAAHAAAQSPFPLPASAAPGSTNALESTAPFLAPLRVEQTLITNRRTLEGLGLPPSFGLWDMITFDATSRYIYVPSEVGSACGVFRYDTQTGQPTTLMRGNGTGIRSANPSTWNPSNDEFSRFDPCSLTPWGSILLGEETTGGRLFEVMNPDAPAGSFDVRWRSNVPAVAHEGLRFDRQGTLYFVDESNSGSIYKFVPRTAGDLSVGQSFVLRVDAYHASANARPSENWNSASNRLTTRFGAATWVPITDGNGFAITTANPFVFVSSTGGRNAADEVGGTPYGRPEDIDINVLASGNEALYVAITSENSVLSIELLSATTAMVRSFVDFNTINLATGLDVNPLQNDPYTSPGGGTVFASPDNIAVDAFGNVYVIEDGEPNGGDVWKAQDANKDGVAESIGIYLSLGISGSEPSGLIQDPNDPYRMIIAVQHPASGNDAIWSFRSRPYPGSDFDLELRTGINRAPSSSPAEFVKRATAFDTANFDLISPNGTLNGSAYVVLIQAFPTAAGLQAFFPPLWMNLFQPIVPLYGGPLSQIPASGAAFSVTVPPGLPGFSVIAQGLAFSPSGALVLTDAHELVLL